MSEYSDDRKSICNEIAETLKSRGKWVPKNQHGPDLIMAVGKALDEQAGGLAEKTINPNEKTDDPVMMPELKVGDVWDVFYGHRSKNARVIYRTNQYACFEYTAYSKLIDNQPALQIQMLRVIWLRHRNKLWKKVSQ